jgi:predicted GIY-YIG superfamily endonuclease
MKSSFRKIIRQHEDFVSIDDKEAWKRVPAWKEDGWGVYALYNNYGLYYIGKTDTSLKSRIRRHKSKKYKKWDKFSWYQTKDYAHAIELESILLRIMNPSGNKKQARGKNKPKRENLLVK